MSDNTYEPRYWNKTGRFQAEHEALWDKLVPEMGEANTEHGEALRVMARLYYDYFNNGACNYQNHVEEYKRLMAWAREHLSMKGEWAVKLAILRSKKACQHDDTPFTGITAKVFDMAASAVTYEVSKIDKAVQS